MGVNHIVWCHHLMTVQKSGDQSLILLLLFPFFFHAVIIPWLENEMAYVKAELLTATLHLFREAIFIVCLNFLV